MKVETSVKTKSEVGRPLGNAWTTETYDLEILKQIDLSASRIAQAGSQT